MWIIPVVIIIGLLVLIYRIFPPSTGKIAPFTDENGNAKSGSIAEKTWVQINGMKQGMIIRGEASTKPVLLFLSGGPGIPDYFLTRNYPTELEKNFVVCYWDYRGTGLSFGKGMTQDGMTTKQFINDAIAVTNYLRLRFGQEKIYLMGHSCGTYIGLQAAAQAPELYKAYISMSQLVDQLESEKLAYTKMLAMYQESGNKKMVKKFLEYTITQPEKQWVERWFASSLRDQAMHELGVGTMHKMKSVITSIFFPTLRCTDYSPVERINLWKGKIFAQNTSVAKDRMTFVAFDAVPSLDIPVYFLAGKYDLTCCYSLQQEYYRKLEAPVKAFYTFENSAHSPLFEEQEKAIQILTQDIVNKIAE